MVSPNKVFSNFIAQKIDSPDADGKRSPNDYIDQQHHDRNKKNSIAYPDYIIKMRRVIHQHALNGGGHNTFPWDKTIAIKAAMTYGLCESYHACESIGSDIEKLIDDYINTSTKNDDPIILYHKWVMGERMMVEFNPTKSTYNIKQNNMTYLTNQFKKQVDSSYYHKRAFDKNCDFTTAQKNYIEVSNEAASEEHDSDILFVNRNQGDIKYYPLENFV